MNPWLHRTLIYRPVLFARGESATWGLIRDKQALERLSPEALQQHVAERLARLLTHASTASAFYRDRWPAMARTAGGDAFATLTTLPRITKRDL